MNEEQVTKKVLRWLTRNNWDIVAFDFPQSGTGLMLHPNISHNSKNKKGIIPDVIVIKGTTCLFFENKDRFYYLDFVKQNELITKNEYSKSITRLLSAYEVDDIYYGIALPNNVKCEDLNNNKDLVDFIVTVDSLSNDIKWFYDKYELNKFFK